MLTKPSEENIAFEVIVPSLPGYGFSEGAAKRGLGPLKVAVVLRNLMLKIGFDKFYVQGLRASQQQPLPDDGKMFVLFHSQAEIGAP